MKRNPALSTLCPTAIEAGSARLKAANHERSTLASNVAALMRAVALVRQQDAETVTVSTAG